MSKALVLGVVLFSGLPGLAAAQQYVGPPPFSWCWDNGWFASRSDGSCHTEDKFKPFPLAEAPPVVRSSGTKTAPIPMPECDDGYELVLCSGGYPACARDFKKPR